jgi:oligopeptidase B
VLPTRDGSRVAHSVDLLGEELYELRFRDVAAGEDLPDRIPGVLAGGAWSEDGSRFYYLLPDDAFRPHQVVCHELGTDPEEDLLVHAEDDPAWELSVRGSRDGGWVLVDSRSGDSSETWLVDARHPDDTPRLVAERRPGVEYAVEVLPGGWDGEGPDRLLLVTNDRVPQFRLAQAAVPDGVSGADADPSGWHGVDGALTATDERLEWAVACSGYVVLGLRRDCEPFLRVLDRVPGEGGRRGVREVHPGVPCGSLRLWHPDDAGGGSVVVVEENLVTAPVWVRIDLATGARSVLRRSQPPGVDPTRYVTERITVPSSDGAEVPVTIARRRDLAPRAGAGVVVTAYGAFEQPLWPAFSLAVVALLDRGVVHAVAHVRGGGELGRRWWEEGRGAGKLHSEDDLVAVRDRLEEDGWASGGGAVLRGRAEGGLLAGTAYSRHPDRWRAVVAESPRADLLTTLCDPALPRPLGARQEWGDPAAERADYDVVRAVTPYEHPPPPPRPPLLVTASVYDRRMLVHEAAKWVARLRATDSVFEPSQLLFRVELGPGGAARGHPGGPAGDQIDGGGRSARLAYEADVLAWVLDRFGDPSPLPPPG